MKCTARCIATNKPTCCNTTMCEMPIHARAPYIMLKATDELFGGFPWEHASSQAGERGEQCGGDCARWPSTDDRIPVTEGTSCLWAYSLVLVSRPREGTSGSTGPSSYLSCVGLCLDTPAFVEGRAALLGWRG